MRDRQLDGRAIIALIEGALILTCLAGDRTALEDAKVAAAAILAPAN